MKRGLSSLAVLAVIAPSMAGASDLGLPAYLRDRGPGIATSLFGTYVAEGELLVYPFYEYTRNDDAEYDPEELGFVLAEDFRAKLVEHEVLLFVGYGLSESIVLELESALWAKATQEKAADDPSAFPPVLEESGFGDTQVQLRWRWSQESARSPEVFAYTEVVFPFQKDRVLLGTQDWEVVQGFGLVKGTSLGTWTGRVSAAYDAAESSAAFGEYAIEYLKRASERTSVVLAIEGEEDEISAIGELQIRPTPQVIIKLNTGVGLTSKAPDVAPEVGVAFRF